MIITGPIPEITILPGKGGSGRSLNVGEILNARVSEVKDGQGVFQLANGGSIAFSGAKGLTQGELVRLEVTRVLPNVAMRVVVSESAVAGEMAKGLEQSLFRAPDLLSRLLALSDPEARANQASGQAETPTTPRPPSPPGTQAPPFPNQTGGKPILSPAFAYSQQAALAASTRGAPPLSPALGSTPAPALSAATMAMASSLPEAGAEPVPPSSTSSPSPPPFPKVGEQPLLAFLEKNLPHLSVKDLLSGDGKAVLNLLGGGGVESREMVRRFREAAEELTLETRDQAGGVSKEGEKSPSLVEGKEALRRLADLASLQEILPRVQWPDSSAIAGYRLFWLSESGLGEMVWRRERRNKGESGEENVHSIQVNLTLTHLGNLQIRVLKGDGTLSVGIAAEEEEALSMVRGEIGSLRERLVTAGLPLAHLDLFRLTGSEMRAARREILGMGAGFAREA